VKPTAAAFEQVAATAAAELLQSSLAVAAKEGAGAQHSTVTGGGQEMVGGTGATETVSLQQAELPEESVAVQVITRSLQSQAELTETVPSAFCVQQAAESAGQAQTTVGVQQVSEPVAETLTAGPPQVVGPELAQVMVGGVVSTTVS